MSESTARVVGNRGADEGDEEAEVDERANASGCDYDVDGGRDGGRGGGGGGPTGAVDWRKIWCVVGIGRIGQVQVIQSPIAN